MSRLLKRSPSLVKTAVIIAVIASSCVAKKEAQTVTVKTSSTAAGSSATATGLGHQKKEGIKKFSDVIPAKTKVDKAAFLIPL